MKQVTQNLRSGTLSIAQVPPPAIGPHGVLVANHFSLISAGTERSTVRVGQKGLAGKALERPDLTKRVFNQIQKNGVIPTIKTVLNRLETPVALGYSCAGTVLEVGEKVQHFSPGDRVACAGQNYASHAETVFVPKNLCAKIPESVDCEDASFVTLGSIALQGVRQAALQLGDRVAVIGLGLVGQLTVQLLKASGCCVLACDLDASKIQLAQELGADAVTTLNTIIDQAAVFSQGHGVDAVIITASTKDNGPVEIAGDIARKKGRVVIVGAVGMNIPRESFYRKELELRLSTSYGPGRYDSLYEEQGVDYPFGYVRWTENRNMEAFLSLIQQQKIHAKRLITHRYSISEADQAYAMILDPTSSYMGVLISYPSLERQQPPRTISLRSQPLGHRVALGIIGAGHHVQDRLLPSLTRLDSVSIRSICTKTGLKAKALAERINASSCTSDSREVMGDPSLDAIVIGTTHDSHASLVIQALEAGKHVFTEKPLCLSLSELEDIQSVYEKQARTGLHLTVGFNRRFSRHAVKAQEFFRGRNNPLTMMYRVNAEPISPDHWIHDPKIGGGRLLGEVCHFVDYFQFVCGGHPTSVYARRIGHHSTGIQDDQCILTLSFSEGSIGTIVYSSGGDTALSKERVEVFGDGKSLIMEDFLVTHCYEHGTRSTFKTSKQDKGFDQEMQAFIASITQGTPPAISFSEIVATTQVCLLGLHSLRTGKPSPVSV